MRVQAAQSVPGNKRRMFIQKAAAEWRQASGKLQNGGRGRGSKGGRVVCRTRARLTPWLVPPRGPPPSQNRH
jgi:hypothetical protein